MTGAEKYQHFLTRAPFNAEKYQHFLTRARFKEVLEGVRSRLPSLPKPVYASGDRVSRYAISQNNYTDLTIVELLYDGADKCRRPAVVIVAQYQSGWDGFSVVGRCKSIYGKSSDNFTTSYIVDEIIFDLAEQIRASHEQKYDRG